jgi:hypothetical protein
VEREPFRRASPVSLKILMEAPDGDDDRADASEEEVAAQEDAPWKPQPLAP